MTRDRSGFYLFDAHLDDSERWGVGEYTCPDCGFEFVYVCRVDREPVCVRCTESDRWQRAPVDVN